MEGDIITAVIKILAATLALHAAILKHASIDEGIECTNFHAETPGQVGDNFTDIAVGMNADLLALEFRTGLAVVIPSGHHDHHSNGQFSNGVGVLAGGVFHDNSPGLGGGAVHIVVACTGSHNYFEFLCRLQHLFGHLVAADDHCLNI